MAKRGSKLLYVGTRIDIKNININRKNTVVRKLPKSSPERKRGGYGLYRKLKKEVRKMK